jgi:hypothetical protein
MKITYMIKSISNYNNNNNLFDSFVTVKGNQIIF